jgi:glycosyltransferase involved in cell wall biosynthesis
MKVLYDSQAFDMQTHGGVSRCFVELYKHRPAYIDATIGVVETDNVYLQEIGVNPSGTSYQRFISERDFPLKKFLFKACYNIGYGHPGKWDRRPLLNRFLSERLLSKGDYDIFHPTFFDDYFLRYLHGKPFVLTIHDMIPELYPQYYSSTESQIVSKKLLAPKAAHIVAVSEQTKRDVIDILNIPENKVSVVYHGADSAPYCPSDCKQDYEYILYVGERHMYKNFIGFCRDCMSILRRHKELKVVCTGKPFTSEELFFFEAFGLADRFVHLFAESSQALLDLYHYAVAFVYPSAYEGFGIPILEAYKADCPVMLNRASCFPEIAGDAAIYFKMKKDSSDFEEQFETLYHLDANERDRIIEKQRKRLELFSWEKSAAELAQVYNKIS